MKTINNFIVEHLKYSTFPINEKLKISSKSNFYACRPKDQFELYNILKERLAENKNADLNDIDVSAITDMHGLFRNLMPHNIKIEDWNVSNVTNMSAMFLDCENFNADLSKWDVSKVTDMYSMFYNCNNFDSDLSDWNVSSVKDMRYMFCKCKKFNCDLNKWDASEVKNMNISMFDGCDSLKKIPRWYKWYTRR